MTRPRLYLALLFRFASLPALAQYYSFSVNRDSALTQLQSELPEGWRMDFEVDLLIIQKDVQLTGYKTPKAKALEEAQLKKWEENSPFPVQPPNTYGRDTLQIDRLYVQFKDAHRYLSHQERADAIRKREKINEEKRDLKSKFGLEYKRKREKGSGPFGRRQTKAVYPSEQAERDYKRKNKELSERYADVFIPYWYSASYSHKLLQSAKVYSEYEWQAEAMVKEWELVNELVRRYLKEY